MYEYSTIRWWGEELYMPFALIKWKYPKLKPLKNYVSIKKCLKTDYEKLTFIFVKEKYVAVASFVDPDPNDSKLFRRIQILQKVYQKLS